MNRRDIEAIYPLSAGQSALLAHQVAAGDDDTGLLQVRFVLRGPLQLDRLKTAWSQVSRRHAALRMSIQQPAGQRPLLVTWRNAETPWGVHDWTSFSAADQQRKLDEFCEHDRSLGLVLSKPPGMRMTVVQLDDETHQVIWTCHHVLLDGWSSSIAVSELVKVYTALAVNEEPRLPVIRPLGEYFQWLKDQKQVEAEQFWRQKLDGFSEPTRLPIPRPASNGSASPQSENGGWYEFQLSEETSAQLASLARARQLTPNALIQGAWALLLSALSGESDVVFGTVVAGRSFDITGSDSMVGMFANVVPVRLEVDTQRASVEWLQDVRAGQFQMQKYEHASPAEIQSWSAVPGRRALFESLVVIQNFPQQDGAAHGCGLELTDYQSGVTTAYPLTLVVTPAESWAATLIGDPRRFDSNAVREVGETLRSLFGEIAEAEDAPIGALCQWLEGELPSWRDTELPSDGSNEQEAAPNRQQDPKYIPPRNEAELKLVKIWEEVLGCHPIGVRDNFFELGGKSLVAVRMFALAEGYFDKRLPLAALWEHPTIEELAMAFAGPSGREWTSLVPVQTSGSKPPIFFIHAGGLHALFYGRISQELGPEQPVYALHPPGLDGRNAPLSTIEEMAEWFVSEIQSAQPEGPYYLAGHCVGASAALEVAQRLQSRNQEVALLAVLDAWPPRSDESSRMVELQGSITRVFKNSLRFDFRRVLVALTAMLTRNGRRVSRRLWGLWVSLKSLAIRKFGSPHARRLLYMEEVQRGCLQALSSYIATNYAGPITVIRTPDTVDFTVYWERLAAEFELHDMSGGHELIFQEPHVEQLGEILTGCLERAHEKSAVEC